MGRRGEQRIAIRVPVLVRGTDTAGSPFVFTAHTHDITGSGASLSGFNGVGRPGEKIEIEYKGKKAPFRVQWVGQEGTARAAQVGVRCLEPGNYIWGVPLPEWAPDSYDPSAPHYAQPEPVQPSGGNSGASSTQGSERRRFPRLTCRIEALVSMEGTSMRLPAKVTDLSLGGCYVEMLSPLPLDSMIELVLNPGDTTIHAHGQVRLSQTGMGMGVAFTGVSPQDYEKLVKIVPPMPAPVRPSSPPRPETSAAPAAMNPPAVPKAAQKSQASTAEAFEAVVRVLFRKGILTRAEVAEEIERLLTPKS